MYSGVTFLPMPSSISLSLLIVAHATVVSMFPVIVADAPDLNASSPSFVSSSKTYVSLWIYISEK